MVGGVSNNQSLLYLSKSPTQAQTQNANTNPAEQIKQNTQDSSDSTCKAQCECKTCASRTYQDKSDDPTVSFQSPTHISPQASGTAVMAHEQEHVTNEKSKANKEGREVIGQSVALFLATCEECKRTYVAGGLTTTITAAKKAYEGNDQQKGSLLAMSS